MSVLCDQVITVAKTLLQCSTAGILSLDNWLAFLYVLPLEIPQLEQFSVECCIVVK